MPWYLNPLKLRDTARNVRRIAAGGGPSSLRLDGIGRPTGCLLPSSTIGLQVTSRDGSSARFDPAIPVPLLFAYGYRIARGLGLPLIASFDPEDIDIAVGARR